MKALFFGCWVVPGHYLYDETRLRMRLDACPWTAAELGGSLAPMDKLQHEGVACLHIRDGWAALAFWDRSGDTRPNSNSAFIIEGAATAAEVIGVTEQCFPELVKRFAVWPPDGAT